MFVYKILFYDRNSENVFLTIQIVFDVQIFNFISNQRELADAAYVVKGILYTCIVTYQSAFNSYKTNGETEFSPTLRK